MGHNLENQVAVPIMPGRFEVKGHTSSLRRNIDTNELWATGLNNCGQLGNNTTIPSGSLSQIPGDWIDISIAQCHTNGIKSDNSLWGWGLGCSLRIPGSNSSPIQATGCWEKVFSLSLAAAGLCVNGSIETKEFNKNYNKGPFTLNDTYIYSRGDNWSDFIPTIDD